MTCKRCRVAMVELKGHIYHGKRKFRQTAKLRPMIEGMGGAWEELPVGTFAAAGTSVRTVLLTATQP